MISIEQIIELDEKVSKAVNYIEELKEEKQLLQQELDSYRKRVSELENELSSYRSDQSEIEAGIKHAVELLDSLTSTAISAENKIEAEVETVETITSSIKPETESDSIEISEPENIMIEEPVFNQDFQTEENATDNTAGTEALSVDEKNIEPETVSYDIVQDKIEIEEPVSEPVATEQTTTATTEETEEDSFFSDDSLFTDSSEDNLFADETSAEETMFDNFDDKPSENGVDINAPVEAEVLTQNNTDENEEELGIF